MVNLRFEGGDKFFTFFDPVTNKGGRADNQSSFFQPAFFFELQEESQDLYRFPQPHVIGQAGTKSPDCICIQPAKASQLVGTQLCSKGGRRLHFFLTAQILNQLSQYFVGVKGNTGGFPRNRCPEHFYRGEPGQGSIQRLQDFFHRFRLQHEVMLLELDHPFCRLSQPHKFFPGYSSISQGYLPGKTEHFLQLEIRNLFPRVFPGMGGDRHCWPGYLLQCFGYNDPDSQ